MVSYSHGSMEKIRLGCQSGNLGNSANLHKSKMAAADGGGIITFLLVNLQSRAIHVFRIILTSEESISEVNFVIRGQILGQR